jgi:hypothetical protein
LIDTGFPNQSFNDSRVVGFWKGPTMVDTASRWEADHMRGPKRKCPQMKVLASLKGHQWLKKSSFSAPGQLSRRIAITKPSPTNLGGGHFDPRAKDFKAERLVSRVNKFGFDAALRPLQKVA